MPGLLSAGFLAYLVFGIFSLRLNPRSTANRLFFAVCLSFAQWALFYVFMHSIHVKENIWFWYRWSSAGAILQTSLIVHFLLLLARRGVEPGPALGKGVYAILYLPAAFFIYTGITGQLGVVDFTRMHNAWVGVYDPRNSYSLAYNIWYNLMMVFCFIIVIKWKKRTGAEHEKKQANTILFYGIIAFAVITAAYAALALLGLRFAVLGILLFSIWIFGIWRAISRYGLLRITPHIALDSILNFMDDAVILADKEGRISWINPAAETLTGYPENELLNQKIEKLFDDAFFNFEKPKNTPFPEEGFIITKEGTKFPASVAVSNVTRRGAGIGFVFSVRDITRIKEAENP